MGTSPSTRPVLVVEDDCKTSALVKLYLAREGFSAVVAASGQDAIALSQRHRPMMAILDILLPDTDGWEVCRHLRSGSSMPILILSSLTEAHDRIRGLTLGADDFLVKPFSPKELIARVKAILRRSPSVTPSPARVFDHDGLNVDLNKCKVSLHGQRISLTRSEFRLLEALIAAPGRIFGRDELLACLYPRGGVVIDRVVDVHLGKLRQKIEPYPASPRHVMTARGLGYYYNDGYEDGGAVPPGGGSVDYE